MTERKKRLLFLCAHRSIRELMAASLLEAQAPGEWNIWIVSGTFAPQDITLVRQVLEEIQVPLLLSPPMIEPSFDHSWDEGVVICSGATNQ
ncbi:hypothetical protein [Ktedonobacter robiniae]|uniref:Phosphotyrosine protein phosphatase I domain-containing protein n=1 Tax=Ktedonobacter robiniae TaxID=2778365 RepID=A0ABQ3V681_9CHLR|nr:hypothetical protein [Ktedonobacter robiniae]GHO60466.1 hypothetical protein KSB_89410 [Ktedonobacter robiniae]